MTASEKKKKHLFSSNLVFTCNFPAFSVSGSCTAMTEYLQP